MKVKQEQVLSLILAIIAILGIIYIVYKYIQLTPAQTLN